MGNIGYYSTYERPAKVATAAKGLSFAGLGVATFDIGICD